MFQISLKCLNVQIAKKVSEFAQTLKKLPKSLIVFTGPTEKRDRIKKFWQKCKMQLIFTRYPSVFNLQFAQFSQTYLIQMDTK